jgi:hypothetical protein
MLNYIFIMIKYIIISSLGCSNTFKAKIKVEKLKSYVDDKFDHILEHFHMKLFLYLKNYIKIILLKNLITVNFPFLNTKL